MQPPERARLVAIVPVSGHAGVPDQYLDLEVLTGFLRESGFPTLLVDAGLQGLTAVQAMEAALREQPAAMYWHLPNRLQFQALAGVLDQQATPDLPVQVAGGYFASRHDLAILPALAGLDAVVHGELEAPVAGLLRALAGGEPWRDVSGLTVWRGGKVAHNRPSPLFEDLDVLPWAAGDLFHDSRLSRGQKVLLNRGCDSDCSYCGLQVPYREGFAGRTRFWRSRSPGKVVDEIEHYVRYYGVRRFVFEAFVAFGYDQRGEATLAGVAREIQERGLEVQWSLVTHPRALLRNEHLLPELRRAGLSSLLLGIDSGLERALRRYRVEFSGADVLASLSTLHHQGIPFDVGFFFFDPWMSFAEIREQIAFLRRIRPFFSHMARPYSFFLDRQLLGTALRLNSGMPLLADLVADGLLVPSDPLVADPAARFADQQAGRFYAVYQKLRRSGTYRALLPRLLGPGSLPASLEEMPLAVAEDLWDLLAAQPELDVDEAAGAGELRIRERLRRIP